MRDTLCFIGYMGGAITALVCAVAGYRAIAMTAAFATFGCLGFWFYLEAGYAKDE